MSGAFWSSEAIPASLKCDASRIIITIIIIIIIMSVTIIIIIIITTIIIIVIDPVILKPFWAPALVPFPSSAHRQRGCCIILCQTNL